MSAEHQRLPLGEILVGDARTRLAALSGSSIDCVISSPPYFALRDYGHPGQMGLEATVGQWVEQLVGVCREIRRVLKPSGGFWLNVGDGYSSHQRQGAPKKSLLLGPQRLAIRLLEDGWLVRNVVVWAKTNPMPASVTDRLSCGHEVLLFLVRSERYFFDLDAIRIPLVSQASKRPRAASYQYLPDSAVPANSDLDLNQGLNRLKVDGLTGHPLGKNPADVWQLPTSGFRGAHFATFPVSLVERPLLASCPEKVCSACGTPWVRQTVDRAANVPVLGGLLPGCGCQAGTVPGVVLDPFIGAGTVALAAEMHGREWIGIELNPAFAILARRRLAEWREQHRSGAVP